MNRVFCNIGPLTYCLNFTMPYEILKSYRQFFSDSADQTDESQWIQCQVVSADAFSPVHGSAVYKDDRREIYAFRDLEHRTYSNEQQGIYAQTIEIDHNHIRIELGTQYCSMFIVNLAFFELLGIERYLLRYNALVLHSSFINFKDKGLVFTAPSGTGKSTQADLWHKVCGARIINGDRSILYLNHSDHKIHVCGLPFCGSSGINLKEDYPLQGIIVLSQAVENHYEELSHSQAAMALFREVSINRWNADCVNAAFTIIEEIVTSVNVLSYQCNMSDQAVTTLYPIFF